jgi:hypothetical protein
MLLERDVLGAFFWAGWGQKIGFGPKKRFVKKTNLFMLCVGLFASLVL